MKKINIYFPFEESERGDFLKMSDNSGDAIKSDLLHLLLTSKGERYYLPDFGTNLKKYLFEQIDNISVSLIKNDINESVRRYIPNLVVDDIIIKESEIDGHTYNITLKYSVSENGYEFNEKVIFNI